MVTTTLISSEEYLAQEAQATHKSEYHAGEVVAMAGTQFEHNVIIINLIRALGDCADKHDCIILSSDILLALPECEKYVYPDVMIVCETPNIVRHEKRGLDILHNPSVVIEVLSESTASYDRTEKMDCYLKLNSLGQYVLVDSESVEVKTYTRTPENDWLMHTETDKNKTIVIGDCEVALNDIYRKVGF